MVDRSKRSGVVVVAPELPHTPLTGAHTRPLSIIRALTRGYQVAVVGAAPPDADLSALRETGAKVMALETPAYARSAVGATLARARQLVSPVPLLSRSHFASMGRFVQEAIAAVDPDALHLVSMYSCWYRDERRPAVIDLLDVVSGLCESAAVAHPWRYGLARLQRRTSAAVERRELAEMAAVITVNDEDARRLRGLGIDSTVIPLSVAVPHESALRDEASRGTSGAGSTRSGGDAGSTDQAPLEILFVGDFLHQPNRAAADFIRRKLMPELKRRQLPVTVTIAGRAASRVRADSPQTGVEYLEDVPDLAPLYRRAGIVLVPIPFGGGTKNKTLEAMAWGKAVVGSPQAFTGVDALEGAAYVSAPLDGAAMARVIARLAADPAGRAALGWAGREYVLRNHTQEIVDERVATVYGKVLGSGA